MIIFEQLDNVRERFSASACKQDGTDLSPRILKNNEMVFSRGKNRQNSENFDKTHVKLFPNFTRHHLIAPTNLEENINQLIYNCTCEITVPKWRPGLKTRIL